MDRYAFEVDTDRGQNIDCDFSVSTIEDEAVGKGWTRLTQPCPVRTDPLVTAGMRGEPRPGPNDYDD